MSASDLRDLRRKLNIAQRPRGSRERVQEMNVRENLCETTSAEEHGFLCEQEERDSREQFESHGPGSQPLSPTSSLAVVGASAQLSMLGAHRCPWPLKLLWICHCPPT